MRWMQLASLQFLQFFLVLKQASVTPKMLGIMFEL